MSDILPDDKPALMELLKELVSSSSLSILLISISSRVISSKACSEIEKEYL